MIGRLFWLRIPFVLSLLALALLLAWTSFRRSD
jgi:hypothetical protein